jgi:hypothetical protein
MTQPKKGEQKRSVGIRRLELKREALKDLDAKADRNPRGGASWGSRTGWKKLTPAMSQTLTG